MAHPVDVHVGKRLRLRRTIMGLSQEALGSAIGVTFQQVQKYERGMNRMGASRLFQFSKLLSIPVSYFFEDLDNDEHSEESLVSGMAESDTLSFVHEDKMTSRETMEMMRAYHKISSPQVRRKIFELVKAAADLNDMEDA